VLVGAEIACLSSLAWHGRPTSRHHLASILAEENAVLFVDPPRSVGRTGLHRSHMTEDGPLVRLTPAPHLPYGGQVRVKLTTGANQRSYSRSVRSALRRLEWSDPIIWNVFPVYSAARFCGRVRASLQFVHMTDSLWDYPWYGQTYESALLRCLERSEFAIGSSPIMAERLARYGKPTHVLEHGVDVDLYRPAAERSVAPVSPMGDRRRPRIGLVGSIDHRLDVDLVAGLAGIGSVTLVGPIAGGATSLPRRDLARLESAGCRFEGEVTPEQSVAWMAGFDVAVLPYRVDELVRASNPLKLLDYLAAGLPVVSVDIPAARAHLPHLRVAGSPQSFLEKTTAAFEESADPEMETTRRAERLAWAEQNSWRRRALELSGLINQYSSPDRGQVSSSDP